METTPHSKKESLASKIAAWTVLALVFLLPFFFIPSNAVGFQFAKVALIYVAIAVVFISWIVSRLGEGKIVIPKGYFILSFILIPVVYILAGIFSPARAVSIFGQGYEIGSVAFVASLAILTLLTSIILSTKKLVGYGYVSFIFAFVAVSIYHTLRLLTGPTHLTFGIFTDATSSLVGSWNDLGIFYGASALLSFVTLELLPLNRRLRIAFIATLIFSLFFLTIVSFSTIWYILGVIAFIFFVYNFSFNKSRIASETPEVIVRRKLPAVSLAVLAVSFVFILFNTNIYLNLANEPFNVRFLSNLAISNIDARPSWSSTLDVAKYTLKTKPILGAGPNRFANQWLIARSTAINNTVFWSTDFNYGIGYVPTAVVTTGILGGLTWLAFFALFLWMGLKALFTRGKDSFYSYMLISSFIVSLYFWLFSVFYVPSSVILVLTFFFTGVFFAVLAQNNLIKVWDLQFIRNPRSSFLSVLVFVVLLFGGVIYVYVFGQQFIAGAYFNKALVAANVNGNVDVAEQNLLKAQRFNGTDLYYRTLTQLYLAKNNQLLNQFNAKQISQDTLQNQFRTNLASAQQASDLAVKYDGSNYQNWLNVGQVYESLVPLKALEKAYEQAMAAYQKASELAPQNPSIQLVMARLDAANEDTAKAKEHIQKALTLKNDYTDAIFFLAQIQVSEKDLKGAIQSTQAAALINPNDPGVFFQLGLLRYNDSDFAGAISALEEAVHLSPDYANAKYFLGLSYSKAKRAEDALKQFDDLKKTNPDNAEIDLIYKNLQAGKEPFNDVKPPLDSTPEKRATPPINEKKTTPETTVQ